MLAALDEVERAARREHGLDVVERAVHRVHQDLACEDRLVGRPAAGLRRRGGGADRAQAQGAGQASPTAPETPRQVRALGSSGRSA